MSELVPLGDLHKMAQVAANSRMFGFKSPDEAMAIMLLCQAEGLHPGVAMRDYHVINGRPSMKAAAMLARFQASGGVVRWTRYDDEETTGVFTHPLSPEPVTITWNIQRAKNAGLAGKDVWKNYGRAMLRSRCISEGVMTCFPACCNGVYTPEEVAEMPPLRDVPATVLPEPPRENFEGVNLLKPDGTIYSQHGDDAEAAKAYFHVVDSINANSRMTAEAKAEKVAAFHAANMHLFPNEQPHG